MSISRRDFLKSSSAIGLAATMTPVAAVTASSEKNRVVIATDKDAAPNGKPDTQRITDLVDHAIMSFTGKTDKAEAYEALFPAAISNSTRIYMKRNEASGSGAVNKAVTDAFQKGLQSMLNGSFPPANIDNPANMRPMANCKPNTDAATYIINCPVAWEHVMPTNNYGVTLSLKNTMAYLGSPGTHHNDTTHAWLWNNSLNPAIKPKQVLSLMDAVVGSARNGPGTSPSFNAGTIIVGNDLVAVDYQTIQLMKKQSGAVLSHLTQGESDLKKAEAAGLGTCTEANMDVIAIGPPWTVGTINGSEKTMLAMNIRVLYRGNRVDFVIPGNSPKQVAVFDMTGTMIWRRDVSGESVSWDNTARFGIRVPSAMYVFRIIRGTSVVRGTVMVRH